MKLADTKDNVRPEPLSPLRGLHLVVGERLVYSSEPESYAGGERGLTKQFPGPPGLGLGAGLTTPVDSPLSTLDMKTREPIIEM